MLSFLNQKLKFLLIVILAIIGVSFIFFGNWTPRNSNYSRENLAVIDGRNIKITEFVNAERAARLIYTLQTGMLAPNSTQADQIFRNQAWVRLLTLAAAKRAGITASDDQIYDFILKHPLFQENGKYSSEARKKFNANVLLPSGINDARFTEILREQMVIETMIKTVAGTTNILPGELENACEKMYGKTSLEYVEINEAQIRKNLKPSEKEIKTFFDANPDNYSEPEKRAVEYVKFSLDPKLAQTKGPERDQALRKLAEKAYEFTNVFFQAYDAKQPLPDFATQAKKEGLEVKTQAAFTLNQPIIDSTKGKSVADSAFALNPQTPVSDYLQVDDGFIILHLLSVTPSTKKSFESVRSQIEADYLNFLGVSRLQEQAMSVSRELRSALAKGKSWQESTARLGLKPQPLPALTPAKKDASDKSPFAEASRFWAQKLDPGSVSDPFRIPTGAAILYLSTREKPAAADHDQFLPEIRRQLEQSRRDQTLNDWIASQFKREKTNIPPEALGNKQNDS